MGQCVVDRAVENFCLESVEVFRRDGWGFDLDNEVVEASGVLQDVGFDTDCEAFGAERVLTQILSRVVSGASTERGHHQFGGHERIVGAADAPGGAGPDGLATRFGGKLDAAAVRDSDFHILMMQYPGKRDRAARICFRAAVAERSMGG